MADVTSPPDAGERVSASDLATTALALARRFHAGATMWCVAPGLSSHGRHVAVEFVHPVIVGKRALPTVHLESADLASALRLLARPGDVLLLVGDAGSETAGDILRRAEAWGLLRITMGAGRPPAPGLAEHSVVLEGADPDIAARSGDVVMLYHLLWELTHVVFEHPGLLESEQECSGPTCVTCADLAEVAEVRSMLAGGASGTTAEVVVAGLVETVEVGLVENCRPGDLVLVQAGVALSRLADLPSATGEPSRAEGVPQ